MLLLTMLLKLVKNVSENLLEFLDFYVDTIQRLSSKEKWDDKKIIQKSSYNFPVVLLFFGQNIGKLKTCFNLMANEKDEKIKLLLASSLGEIINIKFAL